MSKPGTNLPPVEERFANNCRILLEAIKDGIIQLRAAGYAKSVDPGLVDLAILMLAPYDKHKLIQGFIRNSHSECWDQINERNEIFFSVNAAKIFHALPMDIIVVFKDMYETKDASGNSVVPDKTKQEIWVLLDNMVKGAIKYTHSLREPRTVTIDGRVEKKYTRSLTGDLKLLESVDLDRHCAKWNVKLDFPVMI